MTGRRPAGLFELAGWKRQWTDENPIPGNYGYDPLGFACMMEIKNGRVAMMAMAGWLSDSIPGALPVWHPLESPNQLTCYCNFSKRAVLNNSRIMQWFYMHNTRDVCPSKRHLIFNRKKENENHDVIH